MSSQTIKTYLATISHMYIAHDRAPPALVSMPRLKLMIAGVQHILAFSKSQKPRLPITPLVHTMAVTVTLVSTPHEYNHDVGNLLRLLFRFLQTGGAYSSSCSRVRSIPPHVYHGCCSQLPKQPIIHPATS